MKLFLLLLTISSHPAFAMPYPILIDSPSTIIQGERVQASEAIAGSAVIVRMVAGSCTGTALSEKLIVTAAHCPDMGGSILAVRHMAGSGLECSIAEVEEVAYAPGATLNERNSHIPDIALLKLKTPLCGITPAKLRAAPTTIGETVLAAGYGKGTSTRDRPDRVALKTISLQELQEEYADAVAEDPLMQEAVDYFTKVVSQYYTFAFPVIEKTGLCNGDSGGPVYQEIKGEAHLIGVNGAIAGHPSKGTSACKLGYLQMFTPVAPFSAWIESKLREWK